MSLLAPGALGLACGGGADITGPTTGTIEVTTVTTGPEPDADGFALTIDAAASHPIGPNASLRLTGIASGSHVVRLTGLAGNCRLTSGEAVQVELGAGATVAVAFAIACDPTTGAIRVTTTTGPNPDPDGYTLLLDGAERQSIGADATATLSDLAPGRHEVGLSGLAGNCLILGDNPRPVTLAAGETADVGITVACSAPPPATGSLEVTTTTTGTDQDADGYLIALDNGTGQPVGVAATITLTGLAAGEHTVQLSGIAANCAPAGENPRSATVVAGSTARVAFAVTCAQRAPDLGSLLVTTTTTGPSPDPDGYDVTVDGGTATPVGAAASVSISNLSVGDHQVALGGLAANCTVGGTNPRTVSVTAGAAATASFSVTCVAAPQSTGTLRITTSTGGESPDADGYQFLIDGGSATPIGSSATSDVANLGVGSHRIRLRGAAANCAIAEPNPRDFTVVAEQTVEVGFTVTCGPATGSLTVTTATTGASPDPDGYGVGVDAAAPRPLGVSASLTVGDLAAGAHRVTLSGIAGNCRVSGDNPRDVTVVAAATVSTTFAVACTPTTGSLAIAVSGLPAGVAAAVSVGGPGGFARLVTGPATLEGLVPGTYTVTASAVTSGADRYSASPEVQTVVVAAGAEATLAVSYGRVSGTSLNLRIDRVQLVQSIQTPGHTVPLIQGRDGMLRVFAVANQANTAAPAVRVRLYRGTTLRSTLALPATGPATPVDLNEGSLASSWNVAVPGGLIEPGLRLTADVDPGDLVAESDETDNAFPAGGGRLALTVASAPPLAIRLIPVRQRANGLQGDVTEANKDQYLDPTRRMFPLPGYDADVHAVYTTTTDEPLDANNATGVWETVLSEIYAMQIAEGSGRQYYGVVRTSHTSGLAGIGYIGAPAALGYDEAPDRSRVLAHELGHNWGRLHSPCGNPSGTDQDYPYPGGLIGSYGLDLTAGVLQPPTRSDIMGYCVPTWISDYTFQAVLDFRAQSAPTLASAGGAQRCLLVWGRIENGRAVLEPAFELVTRPRLPRAPGLYAVQGYAADGSRLFDLSFEAVTVADGAGDARHFAFAIPLDQTRAGRLEQLRLEGPGAAVTVARSAALRVGPADSVRARAGGAGVSLEWSPSAHPMILVRDPETGEVLSFARGGRAEIPTRRRELQLLVSDGVRSTETRLPVSGP